MGNCRYEIEPVVRHWYGGLSHDVSQARLCCRINAALNRGAFRAKAATLWKAVGSVLKDFQ